MINRISDLIAATQAASNMSPNALMGHLRRRLRNKLVPRRAAAYRADLACLAYRFPAFKRNAAAVDLARMVAGFYLAEYKTTIPGCFEGRFDILNAQFDFGDGPIDWRFEGDEGDRQIRRANLAQFGFVAAAMLCDPRRTLAMVDRLVPDFLSSADFAQGQDFSELWHPYIASRRVLALTAAALLMPPELDATRAARRLRSFARLNAAFVLGNLETELGFNHLERNLAALGLFGLARKTFPSRIAAALRAQHNAVVLHSIGDDGVQKERSAMYQGLTVQSLRIFAALPVWDASQREAIDGRLAAAERALAALTLGDDQPVLFNDGWLGEAPAGSDIVGSTRLGFTVMPDAGYVRLADKNWAAVFDAGAIGPDENPGHGHPDFLSVEASFGPHRLLVDPGTFSYSAGSIRDDLRAWTAHNGPCFVGPRPVTFLGSFKVGKRSAAEIVAAGEAGGVQATTGRLAFDRHELSRTVRLLPDGRMEIADEWTGEGQAQTRFLVPAEWQIERRGKTLTFRRDGIGVRLGIEGARVEIGKAKWSRYYDVLEEAHEILLRPEAARAVSTFRPL